MLSFAHTSLLKVSPAALLLAMMMPSAASASGVQTIQLAVALQGQGKQDAAKGPKEEKKDQNIDDTVKSFEKMPGVFPLYRQKKGASDTIYMEVPESQLGKLFLLQATAGTGTVNTPVTVFHGQPLADLVFKIKKTDEDRVLFLQPDISQRAQFDAETKRTIDRLVPDNVMYTFDIKAKQPDRKSVLIDVTDFLKAGIGDIDSNFVVRGGGGYGIDKANSVVGSVKNYPENFIARVEYRMSWRSPAPTSAKSIPFAVSYNVMSLPENGYRPRLGDPRVGYFTSDFQDISNPEKQNWNVSYIQRWDLKKKDPSAAMSEPEKPLVWWIDNAMPLKYRAAVREGILSWNKPFEKIGIKNAIIVKQMPDDADWDIADVRYNVVRWTVDMPFAIALFRANPMTGQIVNAAINFDAAFASGGARSFELMLGPAVAEPVAPGLEKYADRICTMGSEGLQSMNFGIVANELLADIDHTAYSSDAIVYQYIREVAAHEMGHCLGLRHNFISSTNLGAKELSDADTVANHGVAASLMEYTPYNIFSIKHPGVDFYTRGPGPYDMWAIDYGYRNIRATSPQGEKAELLQIASKTNEPGHLFMSDELANSFDPYVATFDLGKNPLDWTEKVMSTSRYLLLNLGDRKPLKGQSYYQFTRDFNSLTNSYSNAAFNLVRFIGGSKTSQNFRGDAGEKPAIVPVDADTQRRALDQLMTYALGPNSFNVPSSYFTKLAPNPDAPGNQADGKDRQFPVFTSFSTIQANVLNGLFQPQRLSRLQNNEFKTGDKTLSMATLFRTVGSGVWGELESNEEISPLRRQLQREHLKLMVQNVLDRPAGTPDDAVTLSLEQLRSLQGRIQRALPYAKGQYGKPHLEESLLRINKALNAPYIGAGH